ncbi:MAG TPA: nucleotidyltransferase domain-containing protein [Candidatus Eisenbacteria bacterium]|jgi:predicted nucleotidyltransferase
MIPLAREPLIARLRESLEPRPEILDAYLFGSHGRGNPRADSDLDVAVYLDRARVPDSPFGYAAGLATDLAAAVRHDRVDVAVLNDAPPLFYHRVLRDGVRLVARQLEATTGREGRALSRYCDYLPHLRKIDSALAARIAKGEFGR